MKKTIFIILSCLLIGTLGIQAQSIKNVTVNVPGTLADLLGNELTTTTHLIIEGEINNTDFETIKKMSSLKELDFGNANVTNNALPNYAFYNSKIEKIVLSNLLTYIGSNAFNSSNITELDLTRCSKLIKIDQDAFAYTNITKMDFSKCTELEEIKSGAFGHTLIDTLDFSKNNKFTKFEPLYGTFYECTAHVIIPGSITNILPDNLFKNFHGSVDLPEGITHIGNQAFLQAKLKKKIILPTTITYIGSNAFNSSNITELDLTRCSKLIKIDQDAFAYTNITKMDFSKCTELEEIKSGAFGHTLIDTLDFSKNNKFTKFEPLYGTFYECTAHVIIPGSITNILPDNLFKNFHGSVDLPEGITHIGTQTFYAAKLQQPIILPNSLTYIGYRAFENSNITEISIPKSVVQTDGNAFAYCTQLETILSNNPTPPILGGNVFYNVDKNTCKLIVPSGSVELYAAADQWKDFLNISDGFNKPNVPEKVNLIYQIGRKHNFYDDVCPPDIGLDGCNEYDENNPANIIQSEYTAIRIGEYYWMTQNFNHREPFRNWWTGIASGIEDEVIPDPRVANLYPYKDNRLNQTHLNNYLDHLRMDKSQFQVDLDTFRYYYGIHYSLYSRNYMDRWGVITENGKLMKNRREKLDYWGMPYLRDFRQLAAMCPFSNTGLPDVLYPLDLHEALSVRYGDNPMVKRVNPLPNGCASTDYWFNKNQYRKYPEFQLMPSGARTNGGDWGTEICDVPTVFEGKEGDIYHLFFATYLPAKDGTFVLHDFTDTDPRILYHWLPIRWCRKLTDEELGYKLFIKVKDIDKNSMEWQSLINQDELPLLKAIKNNLLDPSNIEITRINNPEATAPDNNYLELPNGYLRGFYVQYNIEASVKETDEKIAIYASKVHDHESLGATDKINSSIKVEPSITNQIENTTSIYPNPVYDVVNISSASDIKSISVNSLTTGREYIKVNRLINSTLDLSKLPAGIYVMQIETATGIETHKIIKK